jgi:ABC-type nitrate/sulfonate/bicarbonate transport system substrate-binding protein
MNIKLAVPDLASSSYFPAVAAAALGAFEEQGLAVTIEHVSPLERCIDALRDGIVHFVGASAHAPLLSFPNWKGAKLLCAQSQGTYWLLVMRSDLGISRGDLGALRGKRVAAVPFVADLLRQVLKHSGIEPGDVDFVIPAFASKPGTNFGVAAAGALRERKIDGFFANGVGAELVIGSGLGNLVLDIRRGDGPAGCFDYTMPCIATTDGMIADQPDVAGGIIRGIVKTQRLLKSDRALAGKAGIQFFNTDLRTVITDVVERDLPYYRPGISREFVTTMSQYARDVGLLTSEPSYQEVVAEQFRSEWID